MDNNQLNLIEMIDYIEPSGLDYQEWCAVGMALQHEGYPVSVWENWSRRDPDRYHAGECERKWRTFRGCASPVTGGTIVQMAKEHGWAPEKGRELAWDDTIQKDPAIIVDSHYIETLRSMNLRIGSRTKSLYGIWKRCLILRKMSGMLPPVLKKMENTCRRKETGTGQRGNSLSSLSIAMGI